MRIRPTTYTVATYILAVVLVMEVVMVFSVFWLRSMVVPVNFQVPKSHGPVAVKAPAVQPAAPPDVPNLAVSGRRTLLALPDANDRQTQIGNLLGEAHTLRSQNHVREAIGVLVQAEDLDPRNPDVLQGLAEYYYLLDDPVRSKIYWRRLLDLGPQVGKAYSLAHDHVYELNNGPDSDPLRAESILSREIYIVSVEKTPVDTQAGTPMFKLKVVLAKKDPNMTDFDQKKLQPYVIFYQNTGDPGAAPTAATLKPDLRPHRGGFENLLLFQNKRTQESLTIEYSLPVPGTPGPDGKPMGEYYGFVIGIYYDKTLQDVRSEPSDLITRLPLPDGIE